MKRTRKTRRTFTDAQKRGLVNEVTTLITQGNNVTEARSKVALKHKTTPISLARWSKDMSNNTIVRKSNGVMKQKMLKSFPNGKEPSRVHVTSVNLHVPGKGNITLDHELLSHISKLAGYTG